MTDLALILLTLSALAVIYYASDGRIRVAVTAALAGLAFWRNYSKNSSSSNPPETPDSSIEPVTPDTTQAEADAQATDIRIDAISHDRPDDPDVRAALDLLDDRDAERRAANGDR